MNEAITARCESACLDSLWAIARERAESIARYVERRQVWNLGDAVAELAYVAGRLQHQHLDQSLGVRPTLGEIRQGTRHDERVVWMRERDERHGDDRYEDAVERERTNGAE